MMGDSKRRKESLSSPPKEPFITKEKVDQFVNITTTGAWLGIGAMAAIWVTVRFLGPALGWWTLAN